MVASHPSQTQYCKMAEISVAATRGRQHGKGCGKKGDAWCGARKQDEAPSREGLSVFSLSPSKKEERVAAEVRQRQIFANKCSGQ